MYINPLIAEFELEGLNMSIAQLHSVSVTIIITFGSFINRPATANEKLLKYKKHVDTSARLTHQ